MPIFGSMKIDTIKNSDICDTYKNLHLNENKQEEKLLQGTQVSKRFKDYSRCKKLRCLGNNSFNQVQ